MTADAPTRCSVCGQKLVSSGGVAICPPCFLLAGLETDPLREEGQQPKFTLREEYIAELFPELEAITAIARGGMGVVYRAHQRDLQRNIALKLLPLEHADAEGWQARFENEARAAARLDHPNIVTLYEFGQRAGSPFLKMKLVPSGRSLAHALKTRSPWPKREAVALLVKIAGAVHHAHQHGVIHRDIKPGNILLDEKGEPYLTDFGLARFTEESGSLTQSHVVLGTASYMAPEQAAGKSRDLTTAADVYGLGAVLYELLSGKAPFDGSSVATILRRVLENEPESLRSLNPEVDKDLATITQKCMEKSPQRRYGSAEALVNDLIRWGDGRPISARSISPLGRITKWARRRPAYAALISLVLVTGMAAITGFYIAWRVAEIRKAQIAALLQQALDGFTSKAGAERLKGKAGRRWVALDAIQQAVAIRVTPALRNEGIACLSLVDIRPAKVWHGEAERTGWSQLTPDFKIRAQTFPDGTIEVRSASDDATLLTLPTPGKAVQAILRFSQDSQFLAAAYGDPRNPDHSLMVWNVTSGRKVLSIEGVHLHAFDFVPGNSSVIVATSSELQLWNLDSQTIAQHLLLGEEAHTVRCAPNGRLMAVSHPHGGVDLVSMDSFTVTSQFELCDSSLGIAWHPKGRYLGIPTQNGMVFVWDTERGAAAMRSWIAHNSAVDQVAWHPNGRHLASSSAEGELALWDARLGEKLVEQPAQTVGDLEFSSDGTRLGPFRGGDQVRLLEVNDGGEIVKHAIGHEGHQVHGAAWNVNGLVLATAGEDAVKFWNRDGEAVGSLPVTRARSVLWTTSALIVTSSQGVFRWPIKSAPDKAHRRLVLGRMETIDDRYGWERADLSRDGRWLALTHPEQITLLDLTGKNERVEMKGQADAAFASISPDGAWLATGSRHGGDVSIWSLPKLTRERTLPGTGGANVLFCPDGKILVVANNSEYTMWKTDDWSLASRISTPMGDYFGAMAFSPRLTAFALESEKNSIWILHPGDFHELAAPDFDHQTPLTFSPEGALLVNLDARSHLVLWNLFELRDNMKNIGMDWPLEPYPPLPPIPLLEAVDLQD